MLLDPSKVATFLDYMIGERIVGGTFEEPVGTPHSPELRAFISALLGENTPSVGNFLLSTTRHKNHHRDKIRKQAIALAGLLREVADAIDPSRLYCDWPKCDCTVSFAEGTKVTLATMCPQADKWR
jgi:hypothetical protein